MTLIEAANPSESKGKAPNESTVGERSQRPDCEAAASPQSSRTKSIFIKDQRGEEKEIKEKMESVPARDLQPDRFLFLSERNKTAKTQI